MSRPAPDIELHIEELVLHGIPGAQRDATAGQLVAALEPMLAEHGLGAWAVDGAVLEQLSAPLEPVATTNHMTLGPAIGRAIASTLRR